MAATVGAEPVSKEPLQLVSVDENGLLVLEKSALHRCFLHRRIEEYPVYLISVIGEKRTGKSFLMNYIMRALQRQEAAGTFDLGAEAETLTGFPWRPGTDKVTSGIWIWSKPFILEQNGQNIAVFLLDTEGSMDIEGERKTNIKMCMLNMLLSSLLVYNVNGSLKQTDIDYLEIYSYGLGSDKLHNIKYLDFLIRNWYDSKNCGANNAESYINAETKKMKERYKDCTFLEVLSNCSSQCFLMPHPGNEITSRNTGRLEDMNTEFQDSLRSYVSGVVNRVLLSIGSADSQNTITCSEMFQMISVFLQHINDLDYNISSPTEMYNMKKHQENMIKIQENKIKNQENMRKIQENKIKNQENKIKNQENMQEIMKEFQDFLSNWPFWKIKIGAQVTKKISELIHKFERSFMPTNEEDHTEQLVKLENFLATEGDKFCRRHNMKLLINGIPVVLALAAVPVAALAAAPVAAAPEAAALAQGVFAVLSRWPI